MARANGYFAHSALRVRLRPGVNVSQLNNNDCFVFKKLSELITKLFLLYIRLKVYKKVMKTVSSTGFLSLILQLIFIKNNRLTFLSAYLLFLLKNVVIICARYIGFLLCKKT